MSVSTSISTNLNSGIDFVGEREIWVKVLDELGIALGHSLRRPNKP